MSLSDSFSYDIRQASPSLAASLKRWLKQYEAGVYEPFFSPLPVPGPTSFTQTVLQHLTTIPFGSVMTYGEVAAALGNKEAARAVGNACRGNPCPLLIPCHRVVASGGGLGGFSAGLEVKRRLLDFEGYLQQPQSNS